LSQKQPTIAGCDIDKCVRAIEPKFLQGEGDIMAQAYRYVVDYEEDVRKAFEKLRRRVFESGKFFGAEFSPESPEKAVELTKPVGTRSILDIVSISDRPQYCYAAAFTPDEMRRFFGTDRPTLPAVQQCEKVWDAIDRGSARYVVVYEGDTPRSIVFLGYSFD